MKTIKIAPDLGQIQVNINEITTEFNNITITYKSNDITIYKEDYLKQVFQTAIALSSRPHQLKWGMDKVLHIKAENSELTTISNI